MTQLLYENMSSSDSDSDSSCGYVNIKVVHFEPSVIDKGEPSYAKGVLVLPDHKVNFFQGFAKYPWLLHK